MPWVRFDDNYLGCGKLADLPTSAIALDMAGIIFSARELRDGKLTEKDVQVVAGYVGVRRWQAPAAALVEANRWERTDEGYAIHDYLDYQRSREEVLAEREANRQRKRAARADRPPPIRPDSGATRNPVPDLDVPNGTSNAPPNPPRPARGARNGRALTDRDEADLADLQARAIPAGGRA